MFVGEWVSLLFSVLVCQVQVQEALSLPQASGFNGISW